MVKDSSAWGSRVGVEAALLAARGFTGRPAELFGVPGGSSRNLEHEGFSLEDLWSDLGSRWRIDELYFKPYPVCRWTHPAVEATLQLRAEHALESRDVVSVEIGTFAAATSLSTRQPVDTEEAQYSLPFVVASALCAGRLGVDQITGPALKDDEILRLSSAVTLNVDASYSARFPAERLADVTIHLANGTSVEVWGATARGDPTTPLSDDEISAKFFAWSSPILGAPRAGNLASEIARLDEKESDITELLNFIMHPVGNDQIDTKG
jgi:2-methylcitrate dehydratase PrpD